MNSDLNTAIYKTVQHLPAYVVSVGDMKGQVIVEDLGDCYRVCPNYHGSGDMIFDSYDFPAESLDIDESSCDCKLSQSASERDINKMRKILGIYWILQDTLFYQDKHYFGSKYPVFRMY